MWNIFANEKEGLLEQYTTPCWEEGDALTEEELEAGCRAIAEQKLSPLRIKSEMQVFLCRNAAVEVYPQEFFADKIRDNSLVWQCFVAPREKEVVENGSDGISQAYQGLSRSSAINPSMDFGHLAPDWEFVIKEGLPGIIKRLEKFRALCTDPVKIEFYDCCLKVYHGIVDLCLRMAACARRNGTGRSDFVAENLVTLTQSAPQTLAQAMQLTLLIYRVQTKMDIATVRSLGGLDHLYAPFYHADLESGRFTEAQLRELLRGFLLQCHAIQATANLPFYIGGKRPDGSDACSDFTYVLLEEYRRLDIHDPKIHVFFHKGSPRRLLRTVLESIREGKSSFVFVNVEKAEAALRKIGIAEEDAKRVIVYGCYETAAEGTEIPATCGGRINLAKAVEFVLHRGWDPLLGERVSIDTGENFATFEEFLHATKAQLRHMVRTCMDIISRFEKEYSHVNPAPIYSATLEHCVETGQEAFSGGAKYNNTSIVCACLASIVDSLLVIKHAVFEEKKITLPQLRDILASDWASAPDLQQFCRTHYPKYGNHHPESDGLARELCGFLAEIINGTPNGRGGVFRFGMFSIDWRFDFGKKTGATPDGRNSKAPLSKNFSADIGQDKNGITAAIQSVLAVDASQIPDGSVLDLVFHASAVKGEDGLEAMLGLLEAYRTRGGFAIQFNVLDPEILRYAQKVPEKYQNLQIRLCGWNVRFVDLSPQEQEEFILQASR